jgi:cation transport regulator ChaB
MRAVADEHLEVRKELNKHLADRIIEAFSKAWEK